MFLITKQNPHIFKIKKSMKNKPTAHEKHFIFGLKE